MPPNIRVDEGFIKEVQATLTRIRNEIMQVRGGVNPGDTAHPHGMPLGGIRIRTGGGNFAAGESLKTRLSALGGGVDQKLSGTDQKLSGYAQGLGHVLLTSDATEDANSSYGAFMSYLTGSPPTPTPTPPIPR